ncbi:MAG: ribosome maturation factor RimP [Microlunatus sp.]|nr:ribosome maturation factor RimP [Microlunatus sp.]MDN5771013.1 ribosome maturation factor RimP [Microlunatus sp.]
MNQTQLSSLLTPILQQVGLELEEISVIPAGKRRLLRVTVDGDGPRGRGPSLDEIADATRAVSTALDSSVLVGNSPYTLEVTSRGINRPLSAPRHWRRNRGRLVAVTLVDGSSVTGRVVDSDDDAVELDIDGIARRLPYPDVAKALVQIEFNRPDAEEV